MASLALQRPALRPACLPAPLAVGRRRLPAGEVGEQEIFSASLLRPCNCRHSYTAMQLWSAAGWSLMRRLLPHAAHVPADRQVLSAPLPPAAPCVPLRHSRCLATLQPAAPGGSQGSNSSGSSSIKVSRRGVRLQIRGWVRDWDWWEVLLRVGMVADILMLYRIMKWLLLTRIIWCGLAVFALACVYSP